MLTVRCQPLQVMVNGILYVSEAEQQQMIPDCIWWPDPTTRLSCVLERHSVTCF